MGSHEPSRKIRASGCYSASRLILDPWQRLAETHRKANVSNTQTLILFTRPLGKRWRMAAAQGQKTPIVASCRLNHRVTSGMPKHSEYSNLHCMQKVTSGSSFPRQGSRSQIGAPVLANDRCLDIQGKSCRKEHSCPFRFAKSGVLNEWRLNRSEFARGCESSVL